jgi:hypothetical protein
MSWEAMLPMGIISAMIFVMGTSQFVIHTTIYGKVRLGCEGLRCSVECCGSFRAGFGGIHFGSGRGLGLVV